MMKKNGKTQMISSASKTDMCALTGMYSSSGSSWSCNIVQDNGYWYLTGKESAKDSKCHSRCLQLVDSSYTAELSASSESLYPPSPVGFSMEKKQGRTYMLPRTDGSACFLSGMYSSVSDGYQCRIQTKAKDGVEYWTLEGGGSSGNQKCGACCVEGLDTLDWSAVVPFREEEKQATMEGSKSNDYVHMSSADDGSACFLTGMYSSISDSYTCRIQEDQPDPDCGEYWSVEATGSSKNKNCWARCVTFQQTDAESHLTSLSDPSWNSVVASPAAIICNEELAQDLVNTLFPIFIHVANEKWACAAKLMNLDPFTGVGKVDTEDLGCKSYGGAGNAICNAQLGECKKVFVRMDVTKIVGIGQLQIEMPVGGPQLTLDGSSSSCADAPKSECTFGFSTELYGTIAAGGEFEVLLQDIMVKAKCAPVGGAFGSFDETLASVPSARCKSQDVRAKIVLSGCMSACSMSTGSSPAILTSLQVDKVKIDSESTTFNCDATSVIPSQLIDAIVDSVEDSVYRTLNPVIQDVLNDQFETLVKNGFPYPSCGIAEDKASKAPPSSLLFP